MKKKEQSPIVSQAFEAVEYQFGKGFEHFSQEVQFAIVIDKVTSSIANVFRRDGAVPVQVIYDARKEVWDAIYDESA